MIRRIRDNKAHTAFFVIVILLMIAYIALFPALALPTYLGGTAASVSEAALLIVLAVIGWRITL